MAATRKKPLPIPAFLNGADTAGESQLLMTLPLADRVAFTSYTNKRRAQGLRYLPAAAWIAASKPPSPGLVAKTTPGTPGTPDVVTPSAEPSLTPDQQRGKIDALFGAQSQLDDAAAAEREAATNATKDKADIEGQRVRQAEHSTNAMIARGLFRSSIRQSELVDIEAAAKARTSAIDTSLAALGARNLRLRERIQGPGGLLDQIGSAYDPNAIQNAAAGDPTPTVPGTPGTPPTTTFVPRGPAPPTPAQRVQEQQRLQNVNAARAQRLANQARQNQRQRAGRR